MNVTQIEKPFCVIGACASIDATNKRGATRNWYEDVTLAEQHAVDLLRRNPYDYARTATELYVVQVVRLVRTPVNYEILAVKP